MLTSEELTAIYEGLDDQGKDRLSERAQAISERVAARAENEARRAERAPEAPAE